MPHNNSFVNREKKGTKSITSTVKSIKWVMVTAILVLMICNTTVNTGCGTKVEPRTAQEKLVDEMIEDLSAGRADAFIDAIPPGHIEQLKKHNQEINPQDMKGVLEKVLRQGQWSRMTGKELHYSTEMEGEYKAQVDVWGEITFREDGTKKKDVISKEDPLSFPLLKTGGKWYLDISRYIDQVSGRDK